MVVRTIVTVMILALGAGVAYFLYLQQPTVCGLCNRLVHGATFYRIFLEDQTRVDVCCPRCGLHFQKDRTDVTDVEAADFTSGERLPAESAFYVENSSVHLCCAQDSPVRQDRSGAQFERSWDRCLPSLVAFRSREDARVFAAENGGVVKSYRQLSEETSEGAY